MFVAGNFLSGLAMILNMVLEVYKWITIIAVLISWVRPDPYNSIVRFLYGATEPVLKRVRRYMPSMGGLDLSPIVVILVIIFLQSFVVRSLIDIASRMN
jgi:YggT family protein